MKASSHLFNFIFFKNGILRKLTSQRINNIHIKVNIIFHNRDNNIIGKKPPPRLHAENGFFYSEIPFSQIKKISVFWVTDMKILGRLTIFF